ncbi:efflux RND transporter permease subunit, partial [Acinetobacter baumannii]
PEVQRIGVITQKVSPDILMVVHLQSKNKYHDYLYVSNYANLNVRDELSRLPGVGSVVAWGGEYAMRVWIDPKKIAYRGLTANDVVKT